MAKSKRKRAIEARDRRDSKKLLRVVLIGGLVMMILMYLLYQGMVN